MSTDIEKVQKEQQAIEKANADIEAIVKECGLVALHGKPVLIQTITLAQGLRRLQAALPKGAVEAYFMPLAGSPLGFLTDAKPNEPYSWEIVRDCVIEAMLRGFRPIGNEMNIIAGRFYGAKNGFERVVREWPGLRDLQFDLAVPVLTPNGALVGFHARWLLAGEPMEMKGAEPGPGQIMDTRIPVKVNAGMGADGILGKATRKMFARIYNRITGVTVMDADGEEMPPRELPSPASPAQDGQRISLGKGAKNGTTAPAAADDPKAQPEPGSNG